MMSAPFPQRRDTGFTLIELVTVMLIIGIMAIVVLPRFDLLRGFDEVGYRDKVRATLEYARKSAVAQRRNVCVQTAGNSLVLTIENDIPETSAGTCTAAANFPRNLTLPTVDRTCPGAPTPTNQICAPANVTLTQDGGAVGQLRFSPLGRPSAAASYGVTGNAPIIVEAETGYVH